MQALVASGLNITYKILYNGHVAMTGGQAAQGALPIPQLTRKLEAEGVRKIVILAEEPERYRECRVRLERAGARPVANSNGRWPSWKRFPA